MNLPCLLREVLSEMTINIRSNCKIIFFVFDYVGEDLVAIVRRSLAIQFKTSAIKSPEERRTFSQEIRRSALNEGEFLTVGRKAIPESLITSVIWEARVNSHSCSCGDNYKVSLSYGLYCFFNHRLHHFINLSFNQ